jgi:ribosomal protein S18 acetylase RimI-like enzyme
MTLPHNLRIRPMAVRDLEAVIAIERESGSAPHWEDSEYLALFQIDSSLQFKRNAMVAEAAGDVAGFAIVRLVGGPGAAEAELESIVVAEQYRGQGLGYTGGRASWRRADAGHTTAIRRRTLS